MRTRSFWDPARVPGKDVWLPTIEQEGVADLAARTAQLAMAGPDDEWWEWMQRKNRWLGFLAEEDEDAEEDFEYETFWSPAAVLHGWPGHFTEMRRPVRWPQSDPYWTLDALAGADRRTSRLDEEFVRGFIATRYGLRADLKAAQAAAGRPFDLPPHGDIERPTIVGEVWVDADGLVRRVVWRQPFRSRRRLRGRSDPPIRMWNELELWDFGLEVEVQPPEAGPPHEPDRPGMLETAGDLLDTGRRWVAWRRAHRER